MSFLDIPPPHTGKSKSKNGKKVNNPRKQKNPISKATKGIGKSFKTIGSFLEKLPLLIMVAVAGGVTIQALKLFNG